MNVCKLHFLLFGVLLICSGLSIGCTADKSLGKNFRLVGSRLTESVSSKIFPESPVLKKRVVVFPFVDKAGIGPGKTAELTDTFTACLKDISCLVVADPPRDVALSEIKPTDYGILNAPELVNKAAEMNMDLFVTGILIPVEITSGRKGIWPFRKESKEFEVSLIINIVDAIDGSLCYTATESKKCSFTVDELETGSGQGVSRAVEDCVSDIVKKHASAIEDKIKNTTWSGVVMAVNNQTIKINAGNDIGVTPGQLFSVYEKGKSIITKDGRPFSMLGEKVGDITITSVMETSSLASFKDSGSFMPGQYVRLSSKQ